MPDQIVFDEDGDLTLIVGEDEQEFIVCSKTVARVSRPFKRMLYGHFKEAKPADNSVSWSVELLEDDATAVEILMNIVHSNFHDVQYPMS